MAQYSVFTSDPEKLHLAQSSSDHHRRSSNLSSGRTNLNLQNRQWTRLSREIYSLVAYLNPEILGYYGSLSLPHERIKLLLNPCCLQ